MSKQKRKSVHSLMNTVRRERRNNARRWPASNRCSDWYDYDYSEHDTTSGGDAGLPVTLRSNQSSGLPTFVNDKHRSIELSYVREAATDLGYTKQNLLTFVFER